ncbi:Ribonucleoside-diphosphate reductase [Caligus rogercresseyi]|uniref:Ribonucleoside-diphosphate reductase n=1 Tax=Caligus rogercresseyi TaxID=217165 RepID=A0A7T8GM70_CALRO|nr:Ribonucleoside-diphosphate reductase [Caligus rogercresseyi]
MSHVGSSCFFNGIVIDVNDLIEIPCDDFGNFLEMLEVKGLVLDKLVHGNGGEIADGDLGNHEK